MDLSSSFLVFSVATSFFFFLFRLLCVIVAVVGSFIELNLSFLACFIGLESSSIFFFRTTIADSVLSYNGSYGHINAIEYARFPFVFVCIAIADGSVIFFIRFIEIS